MSSCLSRFWGCGGGAGSQWRDAATTFGSALYGRTGYPAANSRKTSMEVLSIISKGYIIFVQFVNRNYNRQRGESTSYLRKSRNVFSQDIEILAIDHVPIQ
jgi:hypothetical protein